MLKKVEKLVDRHIRDEILRFIPDIKTSFPTNQVSPLKLLCTMWSHPQRMQWSTGR
jgi:hypothetical protein